MKNKYRFNEFFMQYIHKCRRRVLVIMIVEIAIWWTTIAITGIVLSGKVAPGILMPVCVIAGVISGYHLWKKLPGEDRIVSLIDQGLSLKEGLITAFQYRDSRKLYMQPLIKQITPRLNVSKPAQLFPVSIPRIIALWPFFLIALILHPGPGDFLLTGSMKSEGGSVNSVRENSNVPSRHNYKEKSGSAVSKVMKPEPGESPEQVGIDDNQQKAVKDKFAMANKDAGSSVEEKSPAGLQHNEKEDRRLDSVQPRGRGQDSSNNRIESKRSDVVSAFSGLDSKKRLTTAGEETAVIGTGIAKDKLESGSGNQNNKWDTGQWKTSFTDALQVIIQQDMPTDYKIYVKNYFDAVQKEEGAYGQR